MNTRTSLIIIVILMNLWGLFSSCRGNGRSSVETIEHPPFRIEKRRITERRFDMNRGGMVRSAYSSYRLFYREEPVPFPGGLEVNTGYSGLWKAFILEDAPQPSVIAGSQSMYLITEADGAVSVRPLNEQNSSFASLQWLDAEAGQPGPKQEIYVSDDTSSTFSLTGGRYLLVNQNTVLDIKELTIYPFRRSPDLTEGHYTNQVVAFAPSFQELVFMGSKTAAGSHSKYLHALLVYNFRTNEAYAVPFDQTATRLHDPYQVPSGWLDTYFQWTPFDESKKVKLALRQMEELPPWEGHYSKEGSYQLQPVPVEMEPVFLDFIKQVLQPADADIEREVFGDYGRYLIQSGDLRLALSYLKEIQLLGLSKSFMNDDEAAADALIKKIGDAFNEVLRSGEYQDLFTSY